MHRKQGSKMKKMDKVGRKSKVGGKKEVKGRTMTSPRVKGISRKVFGSHPKQSRKGGFPSLGVYLKGIPKGGLLAPSLRK